MPPEQLPPWDRKADTVFRERKHGYGYGYGHGPHKQRAGSGGGGGGGGGAVRLSYGSRDSEEFSPRWGFNTESRRTPGHGKQGDWHLYQEDSPHGYPTPRSGGRFMDDDCFRPSAPQRNGKYGSPTPRAGDRFLDGDNSRLSEPQGNGRYGRNYRDNRNGYGQKEWRGRSWETNRQYNGPAKTPGRLPSMNDQRSVGDSPVHPSHPNSDPRPQSYSKDQPDNIVDANGSGVSQRITKEDSLENLDWKPLKRSRSGNLTSRDSVHSHSNSLKSTIGESSDVKKDLAPKNVTLVQSAYVDVAACAPSAVATEETASRKKLRVGWGEGLAKYEKKKVEGPEDNVTDFENTASVGNVEPSHLKTSNLVNKSPKVSGFSDCSSPATSPSFACSSSPGPEEKTHGKTTDGDSINCNMSPMPLSENQTEGMQFSLEKLKLNSIANLSALLNELLHVDERFSTELGFTRSSAFSKLLMWKDDISKTLELTETEIDLLENELMLLKGSSYQGIRTAHCDDKDAHCDGSNDCTRPILLEAVSSDDVIAKGAHPSHYGRGNNGEREDGDNDNPGTATLNCSKPLIAQKPISSFGREDSRSTENRFVKTSVQNLITCDDEETTEGRPDVLDKKEDNLCDIILASNRETSSKASEMLMKLCPVDKSHKTDNAGDGVEPTRHSCLPNVATIKKFLKRKRLLKFKERVLSLKYGTYYRLWKKDLRLLSLRSHRFKTQKKLDVVSRTVQIGNKKHHFSIHPKSSAESLRKGPSSEILSFTQKLLSDSRVKIYRSNLKMPAMILDEKDKISSRFVSSNGLVEDPCAVEKERALINPWTVEEKKIFMEKLTNFGKDFSKIASFLDHKTIADCIQFYYKNHKSESFEKTKKPDLKKQSKPLSSDTYMLTSEKKWGRDVNSASLDVLGAASVIAAQADQAMKSKTLFVSNKKARGANGVIETPKVMSNCITNSTVPTDCNRAWKPKKVGSFVRRCLTPLDDSDDHDDDDDDTCSDQSSGEMNPVDWTDKEKSLFVRAFSTHGKDFTLISSSVRTKSSDQCKVFFSKARKCLGLEVSHPRSNSGLLGSNDTNGSGSVSDVETGSVSCSDKSGPRMEEDLQHVSQDFCMPVCVLGKSDCKATDVDSEVVCPSDGLADVSDIGPGGLVNDISKAHAAVDLINGYVSSVVGPPESVSEATGSQDTQCKLSGRCRSLGLTGLPTDLSTETKLDDNISHNPGSEGQVSPFQDLFRKCSRLASQNVPSSSLDTEKPCRSSGDVKLFGKILSKPSPVETASSTPDQYREIHHPSSGVKLDHNGYVGLENVPVRSYGIWDGSKIKVVGYPPSTEPSSSLLLAKYPDAFANRSQSVQVPVNSGECNQNNACEFSPREYSDGNGRLINYPTLRTRDVVASPFTLLEFKRRQNALPEL